MSVASDIPAGYSTSTEMARSLATYVSCPRRIQAAVRDQFNVAPDIKAIRAMRERHLKPDNREGYRPWDGFHPDDQAKTYELANYRYLTALWNEHPEIMRARFNRGLIPGRPSVVRR